MSNLGNVIRTLCLVTEDTSCSQWPESGCGSVKQPEPASRPAPAATSRRGAQEEEERTPILPKRQDRCQSNSTTCADIKHYSELSICIATQRFVQKVPAKKPQKGSFFSLCCLGIILLFSRFIFPFRLVEIRESRR